MADENNNSATNDNADAGSQEEAKKNEESSTSNEEATSDESNDNPDDTSDSSTDASSDSSGDMGDMGGDGDLGSGDDGSGSDGDDSGGSDDSSYSDGDDEQPLDPQEEAQTLVNAHEAQKALGIAATMESLAQYMDTHPSLSKPSQFLIYQNVRLSLAGVNTKPSKVFPALESYEQEGIFKLRADDLRERAARIRETFSQ